MSLKNYLIWLFIIFNGILIWPQSYELKAINFEGNDEISSSTLKGVILSKESPIWFWKFLNSFTPLGAEAIMFDSSKIPFDIAVLKEYYRNNGYFETKINYRYEIDSVKFKAELYYSIFEGPRSKFRNTFLFGFEEIPEITFNNIFQEFKANEGEWFSQSMVEQDISTTISILLSSGYMNASFDSSIVYKDTSLLAADMNVYFTTEKCFYIDSIIINKKGEGAEFVRDELLRKITGIKSGVIYNQDEIRSSQIRLYRTGLFNSVLLVADQVDWAEDRLNLRLDGNIGYLNELSPEIIVNNQLNAFNIGLGGNYIRKNFFGEARKFTFGSSFGIQDIFRMDLINLLNRFSLRDTTLLGYVDGRIKIEQPFLFGRRIFGNWETYANVRKQKNYNVTTYGSKIVFEFELPKYTFVNFLTTSYNIEQSKEIYRISNDSLSSKLVSIIGVDLGRSTTDDFLFPTTGINLSLQFEEANGIPYSISKLFGWNYKRTVFYKILFTGSIYQAVDRKRNNIVAFKFKSGYLKPYVGDYNGLPINRTFYVGGSNSVRGWRSYELVPSSSAIVISPERFFTNVMGGTFLFEGTLEYRYRFLQSFGIVGFLDYGNTWIVPKDFNFYELAIASGIGFRYYTQVAPFRLDFGFKLYDPRDRQYIFRKNLWSNLEFHFGIGEAF